MRQPIILLLLSLCLYTQAQVGCNPSTVTPNYIYYAGPVYNITTTPTLAPIYYLCDSAVVYDTTASGDIDVMICKGAKFIWKPCGPGLSTVWVKNGGTLNFKQVACLTARNIYIEPGAIIIDPYNTMASNTTTNSCASITFPVVNCSLGLNEAKLPEPEIRIAPNPNNGIVSIEILSNEFKIEDTQLKIKNVSGAELKAIKPTSRKQQLDISCLESGIYFLELVSKGKTVSIRKIIKQ